MLNYCIGIEFGTRYITCAKMEKNSSFTTVPQQRPKLYRFDDKTYIDNSILISFNDQIKYYIGRNASARIFIYPDNQHFKNYRYLLEDNIPIQSANKIIFPSDLVKASLDFLIKQIWEDCNKISISNIIISSPSWLGVHYEFRMCKIMRSVWEDHFDSNVSIRCIDESAATLISVLYKNSISLQDLKTNNLFIVIENEELNLSISLFEVISINGINSLKKLYWCGDEERTSRVSLYISTIRSYILNQIKFELSSYRNNPELAKCIQKLDSEIVDIINQYEFVYYYDLTIPWFNGEILDISIDMIELHDFLKRKGIDLYEKVNEYLLQVLSQSKISKECVNGLIFSGSIVSMYKITKNISDLFGCNTYLGNIHGDKAEGAAIIAATKNKKTNI